MSPRARSCASALAAWWCLATSQAQAHAPLPRRVALPPDGSAVALSLPGFGLLWRSGAEPFAYVCDALLELKPSDFVPSLAFMRDGSLLMGSADGLRVLSASGCPRSDVGRELAGAPIMALAAAQPASDIVYAVASGSAAGVWRSLDAGQHWELRSKLEQSELVTALVVESGAHERIYLSMTTPTGTRVLASTDAGASLTPFQQTLPMTLLSAAGTAPHPLWAITRDALTMGNRGLAILRAESPVGPWQQMLRVNYFGGFVVDAHGVIWVGDEIGGLHRSDDGGDTFHNLEQDADVACLAAAGESLWSCAPGTPKQPVLQKIAVGQARADVVTLEAVDRLVACPDLDVSQRCAAAWVEWQRDVRMLPVASPDAGSMPPADAGVADAEVVDTMPGAAGGDPASDHDAQGDAAHEPESADATPAEPAPGARSDCALIGPRVATGAAARTRLVSSTTWLLGMLFVVRRRARRRA